MSIADYQLHKHFLARERCYDDHENECDYDVFEDHQAASSLPQQNQIQHDKAPMKQWLTKCMMLQRLDQHVPNDDDDPWPTAYERLTEAEESAAVRTPQSLSSVDVARAAAVAALACAKLRSVSPSSSVPSPCKPVHNNNPRSETLTAIGSSLSRCSTDISIADSYSPYSGHLSYERRPSSRIRRACDSILQFLANHVTAVTAVMATASLLLLLLYLCPLGTPHGFYTEHDQPSVIDNRRSFLSPSYSSFYPHSLRDVSISLSRSAISSSVLPEFSPPLASPSDHLNNILPSQRRLDGSSSNRPHEDDVPHDDASHADDQQSDLSQSGSRSPVNVEPIPAALQASNQEHNFARWDLALVVLLMSYILCSYAFERLPFACLHESVVSVTLGIVVGLLFVNTSATVRFDFDLFNYILLPPIIFGAGFTLKKRMFYRFFGYVTSFGIFLTLMLFILLAYALEWVHHIAPFTTLNGRSITGLNFESFLVLSAVLCCSDTVAAVTAIKSDINPSAHAVVFGEGVMNDVVSIILSQSLIGVAQMRLLHGTTVELPTSQLMSELVVDVIYYLFTSSCVGVAFGLFISYAFKRYHRILNTDPVRAVSLIFVGSYMSYIFSEMLGFSAIMSIFVCGVVAGHYSWHSLTPTGRVLSTKSASLISFVAEAFVFGYFGIAASSVVRHPEVFSLSLICWISFLIPFCRCLATPIVYLLICFLKGELRITLSRQDRLLVLLGGMMRGTVSYALIIHYVQQACPNSPLGIVLTSTVLGVVLSNVLFFGIALPLLSHWSSKKKCDMINEHEISVINDARHLVLLALDSMHHHTKPFPVAQQYQQLEGDASTISSASTAEPLLSLFQPLLNTLHTPAPLDDASLLAQSPPRMSMDPRTPRDISTPRAPCTPHDIDTPRDASSSKSGASNKAIDKDDSLKPPRATVLGISPTHHCEENSTPGATSSRAINVKLCSTCSNIRRRAIRHYDHLTTTASIIHHHGSTHHSSYGNNTGRHSSEFLDPSTCVTPTIRDWTADDAQLIGETILRSLTLDAKSHHIDGLTKELRHTFVGFLEEEQSTRSAFLQNAASAGGRTSSESASFYTPPHFRESRRDQTKNNHHETPQDDPCGTLVCCGHQRSVQHQAVTWICENDQDTTSSSTRSNNSNATTAKDHPPVSSFNIVNSHVNGFDDSPEASAYHNNIGESIWNFANYRPQFVRKGVDRWWHKFDNRYMKPLFGGRVDLTPMVDWSVCQPTNKRIDAANGQKRQMTADKVERYHSLLKEVLVADGQSVSPIA